MALIIAEIALVVTTINVVLVFLDWWSRFGTKLDVHLIHRELTHNNSVKFQFIVHITNCKASNICIENISYILQDTLKHPIEKIILPQGDDNVPCLLNGYESKLLPVRLYANAADTWNNRRNILYIRVTTSRGYVYIKSSKTNLWKSIFTKSARISHFEHLLTQEHKKTSSN